MLFPEKKYLQSYNVIGIFVVIFAAIITLFLVQEVSAVGRFCIKNGTICRKQIISEEQRNAASDWIVETKEVDSESEEGGTYTLTNEYCSNALYPTRETCNYQFVNVSSNYSAIDGAQKLRQSVWYNREHSNRNTERYCNNGICVSEFPPEFREKFVNRECDASNDCRYHVGFNTQAELKKLGLDDDVIAWGKDRDFGWYDYNAPNRPLRGCFSIGGGDVLTNYGYRSFSLNSRELLFTQANQITGFNCSFLAESQAGLRSLMDVWLPGKEKTPTILSFAVNDTNEVTIKPGEPVTLTWRTKQANTVEIDNNAHTRDQTWWGQTIVNPTNTTTYTLTARAGNRSAPQSVTVNVLEPITNFYGKWVEVSIGPQGNFFGRLLGDTEDVYLCRTSDQEKNYKKYEETGNSEYYYASKGNPEYRYDNLYNSGNTLFLDWDTYYCDGHATTCYDVLPKCVFGGDQDPRPVNPCILTGGRIRLVNCRAGIRDSQIRETTTVTMLGSAFQEFAAALVKGLFLQALQGEPNAPSFTKGVENLPASTINFKCPSCSIIKSEPGPSGSVVVGQGGADNAANALQTITAVRGAVQYGVSPSLKNKGQVEVKYPTFTSPLNHPEAKNIKSTCSSSFERNACVKRETKFITGVDLNDDDVKKVFPSW